MLIMFLLFRSNKLNIIIDKCESVFFGKGEQENVKINEQKVEYKSASKYLAAYIDKNLMFRKHIDCVVKIYFVDNYIVFVISIPTVVYSCSIIPLFDQYLFTEHSYMNRLRKQI